MKVVVAGYGPVGQAVGTALERHQDVELYIDDEAKGHKYVATGADLYGADVKTGITPPDAVIICVATPMGDDGSCFVGNVMDVFKKYGKGPKYLVKSTTAPNAFDRMDKYDITFSPEYLRGTTGANPTQDFLDSEFAVYGGPSGRFWHELFAPVLPNMKEVRYMTLNQAVFVKYFLNVFLASKVTFFNQAFKILEARGESAGFDTIIDGLCLDPRVSYSHTQVPGPDGEFGFGGHCFPKDTNALKGIGASAGADVSFLQAILDANDAYRQ